MSEDSFLDASYLHCARVSRVEAKNFYPSFLLLPADRRRSMCALYAFMRQTDDIADEPGAVDDKRRALDAWRKDLDDALAGRVASWPGWPALAHATQRHAIPTRHLHEVIEGVAMDLAPRPIATFEELRVYCDHVASAVGLCCIRIWGYQSDGGRAETMAISCGLALQLTNIIRDVGEDARNDRIYLPEEDLRAYGVSRADLSAARAGAPLKELLAFEARRAYQEYERSAPLASLIDPLGRPVLETITGIYRTLLDTIAQKDYDVLTGRISVPRWRKAVIIARAFAGRFARRGVHGLEARTIR